MRFRYVLAIEALTAVSTVLLFYGASPLWWMFVFSMLALLAGAVWAFTSACLHMIAIGARLARRLR